MICYFAGDRSRARALFERSVATAREIGDQWRLAVTRRFRARRADRSDECSGYYGSRDGPYEREE